MNLKTNDETMAALRGLIRQHSPADMDLHQLADQIDQELERKAAAAKKRLTLGEVDAMLRLVEAADANLLDQHGTDRRTLKGKLEGFRAVTVARAAGGVQ